MARENWDVRNMKEFLRHAAKPALSQPGATECTHDEEIDVELRQTLKDHTRRPRFSGGHDLGLHFYLMVGEMVGNRANDVPTFRPVMAFIDIEKRNLLRLPKKRHRIVDGAS